MPKDKNYTEDEHFLSRMYLKEFSEIKKKGNKEKSSLGNTLIEAMKYYSIIDEPNEVYSSHIIAVLEASSEANEK